MTHPFEIEQETTLPADPEQVWEAIATGPGIDSWFMGRNEVEPREGGTAARDTGGNREESVVTAYEPGKRFATRTATAEDGRFMAFEYLIEGRGGGSTVLRIVQSGVLGDDWQDEYDALRRGWPFHLHTLREYLAHFPGRTGVPVFALAPSGEQPAQQVGRRRGRLAAVADRPPRLTPTHPGARPHRRAAGSASPPEPPAQPLSATDTGTSPSGHLFRERGPSAHLAFTPHIQDTDAHPRTEENCSCAL
ncbi:SRPBCC domain-containing protein [Streptomyces sp. NPDC058092]|uniref:SRPBCC family protein n=1 Tax=Streptomyces sp. NPDC058092 TaxID=3346336 RepID=UPI0036EC4C89